MGICWSESPPSPIQSRPPIYLIDKAAPLPSAPPYQAPRYTVAVMPQQQQKQMGVGTAMVGGFVLGAIAEDSLDPSE
jgi:hypothetical protein